MKKVIHIIMKDHLAIGSKNASNNKKISEISFQESILLLLYRKLQ